MARPGPTPRSFSGAYANYQLVHNANGTWTVTDLRGGGFDGIDTLTDIEWVQFSDTSLSLDSIGDPPADPVPAIVSISNDSGTAGDRITNDNTLTLERHCGRQHHCERLRWCRAAGYGDGRRNRAWTFATAVLADGVHSFTATDAGGLTSAVLAVTVDTVAPTTPTIDGYSPDSNVVGDGVTNANTLTLFGTAQANNLVHVYDGATLLGTATANGSGAWSFTTFNPAAGQVAFVCGCASCGAAGGGTGWAG